MTNPLIHNGKLPDNGEVTFFLLKPETYLLDKKSQILTRIAAEGFKIIHSQQIKLTFKDLMRMYRNSKARITMSIRLPHLMYLDLYIVEGNRAIDRMHQLKYQIRKDILGWNIGGFLHAPDSIEEFLAHMDIFSGLKSIRS